MTDQKESSTHLLLEMVENNKQKFKDDEYKKMVETIAKINEEKEETYFVEYTHISIGHTEYDDEDYLKIHDGTTILRTNTRNGNGGYLDQWRNKILTNYEFKNACRDKIFPLDRQSLIVIKSFKKI